MSEEPNPLLLVIPLIVLAGGAIFLWKNAKAQKAANEKREREERAAKEKHEIEQWNLRKKAKDLFLDSQELLAIIANKIIVAERSLDKAASEFEEGAFAPFWDAIERAIQNLASFEGDARRIVENSGQHRQVVLDIEGKRPEFSLALTDIPDPRVTFDKLSDIVRRAQKNYQFASIYEQKQTNKILVAGFGTLANALETMGDRIASSIYDLSHTITVSLAEQTAAIEQEFGSIKDTLEDAGKSRQQHEKRVEEMLDNIQSHRKPR